MTLTVAFLIILLGPAPSEAPPPGYTHWQQEFVFSEYRDMDACESDRPTAEKLNPTFRFECRARAPGQ